MKTYWQDELNPTSADQKGWSALKLSIENSGNKPPLHIQTCANRKFRIQLHQQTILWAQLKPQYQGVSVILGDAKQEVVPAITSAAIQQNHHSETEQRFRNWSRYFAEQLCQSHNTLLHDGEWFLVGAKSQASDAAKQAKDAPIYPTLQQDSRHYFDPLRCIDQAIRPRSPLHDESGDEASGEPGGEPSGELYIDWMPSVNYQKIIAWHRAIEPHAGRYKWWRKQAKAGEFPPVVLWFCSGLGAWLVLDGHVRLQAAVDVGVTPEFLLLYCGTWNSFPLTEERKRDQAKALHNLEQQYELGRMSVQRMNQTLLNVFACHDFYRATSTARGGQLTEAEWNQGVAAQRARAAASTA